MAMDYMCLLGGMANSCSFEEADAFCASTYGGQLTSLNTQYEYDQIEKVIHGNTDHFLLGMKSDGALSACLRRSTRPSAVPDRILGPGAGNWEYSDGTAADMEFLQVTRCSAVHYFSSHLKFSPLRALTTSPRGLRLAPLSCLPAACLLNRRPPVGVARVLSTAFHCRSLNF